MAVSMATCESPRSRSEKKHQAPLTFFRGIPDSGLEIGRCRYCELLSLMLNPSLSLSRSPQARGEETSSCSWAFS